MSGPKAAPAPGAAPAPSPAKAPGRQNGRAGARFARRVAGRRRIPQAFRTPLGVLAVVIAAAWILTAILAPWLAPHDPVAQDFAPFLPPSGEHWFGTDETGRDYFSRVIAGSRISISLTFLLVAISIAVGSFFGIVAGFFGRWLDEVIMRFADLFMSFPTVILAMITAAALGPSLFNSVLAAVVVSWPLYARLTRSLVLNLRQADYVSAARLLGQSPGRVMSRDVLPNIVSPTLIMGTLDLGTATLLLSGLSFLGLGAKPPTPEWGSMVSFAIHSFDKWWLGLFPGLAIFTVVVAFNIIGDLLRDQLDPEVAKL
ncbi:MAG: ABC transporter permease [Bifidobacteriaceae bacterium]|jgi:peptide/nickel transport system permease protein|nr:ABC transporter permease [Bifidobacteriaceae bacterium]